MKTVKMKKVLIIGVTGNCGRVTAETFINQECQVYGVGRSDHGPDISDLEYIRGDICDRNLSDKLPKDIDLVINFAGVQPSIMPTSENTDLEATLRAYVDINIGGVFNVLEYVRKNNIPTYVYTTTHRDYELHWKNNLPLGNCLPTAINYGGDHAMYAISKTSAKMIGDYYSESFGVRTFNLRLPMIFLVPKRPTYLKDGKPVLMPFLAIIEQAMQGQDLEIWGDPDLKRDYVYVENLTNLINLCYCSDLPRGTFNVGTGEAVTTAEFVKSIADVFAPDPSATDFVYRPEKHTYKCAVYDITEQKTLLGYQPVLLKEMLLKLKSEMERKESVSRWGWGQ